MHYRFHANIFRRPDRLVHGPPMQLRGVPVTPLREPDGQPPTFDESLDTTFEQTLQQLSALPRLDAEPDGFFVVSGTANSARWQLDGHLFDFDGRLHRVELHGYCPDDVLDAVIGCIRVAEIPLAFELVQEGVALDQAAFQSWAAATDPSSASDC